MKRFMPWAAVVLAISTGCVHRDWVNVQDHPTQPVTAMQASIRKSFLFGSTQEFAFYTCAERGDQLQCKRLCGGDTDLSCPKVYSNQTTNVR